MTVFKAADVDTGFLPGSKHVESEELVKGLASLRELIDGLQELAGFQTENKGVSDQRQSTWKPRRAPERRCRGGPTIKSETGRRFGPEIP